METLIEEVMVVLTVKDEFEYRDKSIYVALTNFFQAQDFDVLIKSMFFHELLLCMCHVFQSYLDLSLGCSTETLLQEIKSVVAETHQFESPEYQDLMEGLEKLF